MLSKWDSKSIIPTLANRTYIVTGANSGIGFSTTKLLVKSGAHVIMACRNEKKALLAIEEIKKEYPNALLTFFPYDQADFVSIENFVLSLKNAWPHFDGVVFNAGIYHPAKGLKTKQGYPLTVGTNYIGAYYLLRKLLEHQLLDQDHEIRLLFVGSLIWRARFLKDPEDILINGDYGKQYQYNAAKTAIGTLAFALHNGYQIAGHLRLPNNVRVQLMHPGVTDTNIVNSDAKGFPRWFTTLAHKALTLFTHRCDIASLGIPLLLGNPKPDYSLIAVPRGLFHISGYPKLIPYPRAVKKNPERLLRETAYILKRNKHL
ncbi:MAG: SDR family NAD(P)-dependent oxidoreductase [Bacilli bacterium]|jgi:NAD(P)-dependent dehydrogenase (short-subunit alcohol dehydrogenase family)|nr:SDR family NAD(P)-dependent oxidoreductase [Bacilli bacterium]MDD3389548.1 SDR family NAD(P)-dependent oxidoreductase [Bacilli bacterium]MDD4345150.1 SDR family NAD(P)-dependent oxidoreductase [Bacilli bacterium]MDD4521004.1 SDR family NAD(P)-dependent oxidoreductase [Bacilli bacterium]MDY0399750.1 SDR family NAD(P)-dependent oxidoreductase [Bacilli bacterium]